MTPRGESGSKSIVRTYIRSDRGESDVQGSAPDIVAPQVVKRTHGLLIHSSDALVDGVPVLVGSSTLREDLNQPLSLLKQKRSGKWDVGHFIAWITPPPPPRKGTTYLRLRGLAKLLAYYHLVHRVVFDIMRCVPPLLEGRNPGVELQHSAVIVKAPECNLLDDRDMLVIRSRD